MSLKKDTEKSHDSAQYHTARNLTLRSMILLGTSEKHQYLGKNENILTHWQLPTMPRPVRMMKKIRGRKSRWTVPLMGPRPHSQALNEF